MAQTSKKAKGREARKSRIRNKLQFSAARPRLAVYRSGRHMYAQIIDDVGGKTIVSASTLSKEVKGSVGKAGTRAAATKVGELIAQKAKAQNISSVCFDRSGYLYHGRVRALADAAREKGLKF